MTLAYDHWRKHGIVGPIVHVRQADMCNDLDLTRAILAAIRDKDNLNPTPVQIPDYPPVLVMRHVQRLVNDGLVEGVVCKGEDPEVPLVLVTDMTTDGHTLLAALEHRNIWDRLTKALSSDDMAVLSIREIAGLAKDLALVAARNKLGL